MVIPEESPAAALLRKLAASEITIPWLFKLAPTWEPCMNVYEAEIEAYVTDWSERWLEDPRQKLRVQVVNPSLLARWSVPEADLEGAKFVALWLAWIYNWDDGLDCGHDFDDIAKLVALRQDTIETMQESLLGITSDRAVSGSSKDRIIGSYAEVSESLRKRGQSDVLTKLICESMIEFISSATEQHVNFQKQEIQQIDQFWEYRLKSSAAGTFVLAQLHAVNLQLPDWFYQHEDFKRACHLANFIISASNEFISLRNEISHGHVDNIIPILMHHEGITAQKAVDKTADMVRKACDDLDNLGTDIIAFGRQHDFEPEASKFVRTIKLGCAGIWRWSYTIHRYILYDSSWGEADVRVALGQGPNGKPVLA